MIYYSKSTKGFYDNEIHKTIPSDAVVITSEVYLALLRGENGKNAIQPDENGYPILVPITQNN